MTNHDSGIRSHRVQSMDGQQQTDPARPPAEIPVTPNPQPEIEPAQQPEPEIPQLPPDTSTPYGPQGPEIFPDPSPTEFP
jgi:hypothetical protein